MESKKKSKNIFTVIVLLLVIGAFTYSLTQNKSGKPKETNKQNQAEEQTTTKESVTTAVANGSKAPDFTLTDLNGKTVKLSDFKGKKVFLNFWATWCGPCEREMPDIEKFHKKYPDCIVLAVNMDPDNDVKGYVTEKKLTFPILLDRETDASYAYEIMSIPSTFFIDSKGIIRQQTLGTLSYEQMVDNYKTLN